MSKGSDIYRGYDIEPHPNGGYVIFLDGKICCSQPSMEFAYKWIDAEKKRAPKSEESEALEDWEKQTKLKSGY